MKPVWRKFEGWTRRTTLRPAFGERRLEVLDAGPVRRPDLDQLRPGPPDDLRDPDAAADLDQLPAADDDAAAPPGEADGQRDRRRVVVRHERVLGARQGDEVLLGRPEARAAAPGLAVELEQEIVARGRLRGLDRGLRPRRAPEVRVDDDAGRVDRRGERRSPRASSRAATSSASASTGARLGAGRESIPLLGDDRARGVDERFVTATLRPAASGSRPRDGLDARWVGTGLGRHRSSWRERMGVEPTTPRRAPRHWF